MIAARTLIYAISCRLKIFRYFLPLLASIQFFLFHRKEMIVFMYLIIFCFYCLSGLRQNINSFNFLFKKITIQKNVVSVCKGLLPAKAYLYKTGH
ncbi:MAG: hypothetical protein C4308_07935 [Chitinophagaceae bacterium]